MNKIKRLLVSMIFTEEQRNHIWGSLEFSEYTYKRRGNDGMAEEVKRIMDSLEYIIRTELPEVYTQAELDSAIEDALKGASAAAEDILQYEKQKSYDKGFNTATGNAEELILELEKRLVLNDLSDNPMGEDSDGDIGTIDQAIGGDFGVSVGYNMKGEVESVEMIEKPTADNQVTFPKPHQVDGSIKVRESLIDEMKSNE